MTKHNEWEKVKHSELKIGDVIFVFHDTIENMGVLPSNPDVEKVVQILNKLQIITQHQPNLYSILGNYGQVYRKISK